MVLAYFQFKLAPVFVRRASEDTGRAARRASQGMKCLCAFSRKPFELHQTSRYRVDPGRPQASCANLRYGTTPPELRQRYCTNAKVSRIIATNRDTHRYHIGVALSVTMNKNRGQSPICHGYGTQCVPRILQPGISIDSAAPTAVSGRFHTPQFRQAMYLGRFHPPQLRSTRG